MFSNPPNTCRFGSGRVRFLGGPGPCSVLAPGYSSRSPSSRRHGDPRLLMVILHRWLGYQYGFVWVGFGGAMAGFDRWLWCGFVICGVVGWIDGCDVGLVSLWFDFGWWGLQFDGVMDGGDGGFGLLFCFGFGGFQTSHKCFSLSQ